MEATKLQQYLPFTVLKHNYEQGSVYAHTVFGVATVLTVYGIETINQTRKTF